MMRGALIRRHGQELDFGRTGLAGSSRGLKSVLGSLIESPDKRTSILGTARSGEDSSCDADFTGLIFENAFSESRRHKGLEPNGSRDPIS
jgi:hypothetical protein